MPVELELITLAGLFWSVVGSIDIFERPNVSSMSDVLPIWSSLKVTDIDPTVSMAVNVDTSSGISAYILYHRKCRIGPISQYCF